MTKSKKKYVVNIGPELVDTAIRSLSDPKKSTFFRTCEESHIATENTESQKKDEQRTLLPVSYHRLFYYSNNLEKCLMCIGFISAVVTGCCQSVNIICYGTFLGSMVDFGAGTISSSTLMADAETFTIRNSIIGVVSLLFNYLSTMLCEYCGQRQIFRLRNRFLESALYQDITWYDLNKSSEIASCINENMTKLESGIGEKVVMFVHYVTSFVVSIMVAGIYGWKLTLVCMISLPLTLITLQKVGKVTATLARSEMQQYARAGSIAEEVLSSIRTVVAFGGQKVELNRYKKNLKHAFRNNVQRGFFVGVGIAIIWFFAYSNYAISFWYGVTLLIEERSLPREQQTYTASTIVTIFMSVLTGSVNIGLIFPFIESFEVARGAAAKIYSVVERKSAIDTLSAKGQKPKHVDGSIIFKNVTFEYPSRPDVKVLQGLTFSINQGETVALVGGSGCGKSTCVQLLQRFYDPREGQISLDGYDLRDLNVKWLRSIIGVVGQEPVLFGTTIFNNIRYGSPNATKEDIVLAAKEANAHDFITKLPNGYKTMVGEKGLQVSGGQKQRIAIARALVRSPKVLLLDEATSALDTRSEAIVQAALDKASTGRTTIIVAHRLSTVRRADKIIVLSNGVAVEEGTHDKLMALKGHYYSLVTAQISGVEEQGRGLDKYESEMNVAEDEEKVVMNDKEEEVEKSVEEKAPVWRILKLSAPEWHYILAGVLSSAIFGSTWPLFSILFSEILGVLSSPDAAVVRSTTNFYCIFFLLGGIVISMATFIQNYTFAVAGERVVERVRGLAFEAMLRQEMAWFDRPSNETGSLCAKLSGEAAAVQGATGRPIGCTIQSLSTITLGTAIATYYHWKLGLVGLAFMPLILMVNYLHSGVKREEIFNHHSSLEAATKIAVEAVSNIRTVTALGSESTFLAAYEDTIRPSFEIAKKNTHHRGLVLGLARSTTFFAYAACMYYGGYLIVNEGLDYSVVIRVGPALIMSAVSIGNAFAFIPNFHKGLIASIKMFTLMNRQSKMEDPEGAKEEQWVPEGEVGYKSVSFKYPTRPGVNILQDLNLNVPSGKTVALIGPSGCGKSTVIQLLERFYNPDSGVVSLGGRNITSVTQRSLRTHLGIVSQEPSLFARTIAENIAYGDNTRDVQMAEIVAVAKKANIHSFIVSLPLGYNTELGDRGTQLSGGQKQRVAIARSLIRNPKVLLLDEATSALDMESEKIVQAALDDAKTGRTCITIAHRLATIQDADKICVLDKGAIAESGTHSELVQKKGLYYKLLTMQK